MAMTRFASLLSVVLSAACGGQTLDPEPGDPPAPVEPTPEPAPVDPVARCQDAPSSWQALPAGGVIGPPALSLAPDEGAVALIGRWSAAIVGFDGGDPTIVETEALDAAWTNGVRHGETAAELIDLASGEPLATLDLSPPTSATLWLSLVASRFDPSGNVLTLACHGGPDDTVDLAITRWGASMHGIERVTLESESCWTNWADDVLLAPAKDGGVVTVTPGGSRLFHAHPSTGIVTSVDALEGAPADPPAVSPYSWPILALDVDSTGERAAVTSTDGKLRIWKLPSLELERTLDAGFVGVNEMTYTPTTESPVAWSPDGKLIAYMRPGNTLVIRDLVRDEIVHTVIPPARAPDQAEWLGSSPMAVKFLPSGDGFVVAFEHGVGLWNCGG
jgi:hypothetical protein